MVDEGGMEGGAARWELGRVQGVVAGTGAESPVHPRPFPGLHVVVDVEAIGGSHHREEIVLHTLDAVGGETETEMENGRIHARDHGVLEEDEARVTTDMYHLASILCLFCYALECVATHAIIRRA